MFVHLCDCNTIQANAFAMVVDIVGADNCLELVNEGETDLFNMIKLVRDRQFSDAYIGVTADTHIAR